MKNLKEIVLHYLLAALWTEELDGLSVSIDVPQETNAKALADVELFVEKAGALLDGIPDEMIGHDFWLTRNGHGVGFWDREEIKEETGKRLTDICSEFKAVHCFKGEDGKVYFE